jgi:hypothetical protein
VGEASQTNCDRLTGSQAWNHPAVLLDHHAELLIGDAVALTTHFSRRVTAYHAHDA